MHIPVLLNEIIEILNPQLGEFFIDGTIGNGGHAIEIFNKIIPKGKLLGIDLDKSILDVAGSKISIEIKNKKLKIKNNLILEQGNYANLPEILKNKKLPKADGLILDLGFSSEHLNVGRGFSFQKDEFLDMRYNLDFRGQTAAEVINIFSEKILADIIYEYGEERYSRRIAKNIVKERKLKLIKTTFDLVKIIKQVVPKNYEKGRINPATRTFQALRIYVNDELSNLENILKNIKQVVKIKGRVVIISYHSLEDRLIKNYFRELKQTSKAKILTKKPIRATKEEIEKNPRSRSAKMRAIIIY